MNHTRFLAGAFLMGALGASPAIGQVQRTFVSGAGSDSNPCSRAAPCRTFAQAISQTNAGGEVIVLDSAGYGPVTISKAISITAPAGIYAGIAVFSGDGVDINAGASDAVMLRGLTVNSQGTSGSGVVFNSGGTLHVENCVVNGFSALGLHVGLFFRGAGTLELRDSFLSGNGVGVWIQPASGTAVASIEQVRLQSNAGNGLVAREGSHVIVRNSIASTNGGNGFVAVSGTAASVQLNLEGCIASSNADTGVVAAGTSTGVATIRVSNCAVTNNLFGLANGGSQALVLSRGNNTVEGNGTDTSGLILSYSAK